VRRRTPPPDELVDPVRAVEAAILVAHDRMRDAELAGNDAAAVVARKRVDELLERRARLVQVSGVDR
jgi:hypothetical protein